MKNRLLKKLNDTLAIITFFAAGYISLNSLNEILLYNILGIAFFIAGLYGIVSIGKNKGFIFSWIL
jgi:hypothetical protein